MIRISRAEIAEGSGDYDICRQIFDVSFDERWTGLYVVRDD